MPLAIGGLGVVVTLAATALFVADRRSAPDAAGAAPEPGIEPDQPLPTTAA